MYPTVEVRGFRKGKIPASVLETYRRVTPFNEDQPPRVDYYLRLP